MSSSENDGPRLIVTADDHRAILVIVVIICMIWSIFVIGARAIWRLHQKSLFGLDDSVALFGTIVSLAQGGVTLGAVGKGFGLRERLLDSEQIEASGKFLYAGALLYVLGLGASRASMPLLIGRLTRDRTQVLWSWVLLAVTLVWGIASTFAIAFECGIPVPWNDEARSTCSGLFNAWAVIESLGLLIEALILGMVISLVINLNMLVKFKIAVVCSFSLRALLVIPVAFRLSLLRQISGSSNTTIEPFFKSVDLAIVTQAVLHYSLWAASFPCMRAFLRAFDTGMGVTTRVPTYKGSNYNNEATRNSSFAMRSLSRSGTHNRGQKHRHQSQDENPELSNSLSKEMLRRRESTIPSSPVSMTSPTIDTTFDSPTQHPHEITLEHQASSNRDIIDTTTTTMTSTPAKRSSRIIMAKPTPASNSSDTAAEQRKTSDETASQHSTRAIITRTVEWTVEVQDRTTSLDNGQPNESHLPGRAL